MAKCSQTTPPTTANAAMTHLTYNIGNRVLSPVLPQAPLPIDPQVPHQQQLQLSQYHISNLPTDPNDWTIDQVIGHISFLDSSLATHVEMFRGHEIDGKALLLLTSDMMMKYMDMKLGPALKICNIVNMIQGKKHLPLPS